MTHGDERNLGLNIIYLDHHLDRPRNQSNRRRLRSHRGESPVEMVSLMKEDRSFLETLVSSFDGY